jgi:hypothetical protein
MTFKNGFPTACLEVKIINLALNISYAHRGVIDTKLALTVIPTFIEKSCLYHHEK